MAAEAVKQDFPRVLYKHRDPITTTVYSQIEQDQYLNEGYSLSHRPQEQVDQEQYLTEYPEAKKSDSLEGHDDQEDSVLPEHEAMKESDVDHDHKADIVKQDGQ